MFELSKRTDYFVNLKKENQKNDCNMIKKNDCKGLKKMKRTTVKE